MRAARIALVGSLALAACAPTPADKTQANLQTIQMEQSPERLFERGKGFALVGDSTRAEEYFVAAIEHGADGRQVVPHLLEICVRDGRYRVAIEYAEQHLAKYPKDLETRFVLGTLYAALGDSAHAKSQVELVIQARPDESKARYAMAVILRDAGDVVGADREFREYLRIEPNGAHAEEARGSLLKSVQ